MSESNPTATFDPDNNAPLEKVLIIVSRGSLDGIYPGLVLANGARMEGIEASMFFTFFGLNALAEKTMDSLKVATVGNPAMNMAMPMLGMPMTMPFPTMLGGIPGVSNFATHLMNQKMEELDIPPVREFLEMITDAGGKVFACKLAMDMFGLKRDDLWEGVESVLTVGDFYQEAAGTRTQVLFT
ncbi:MAG: DsrE/DsrF/DrsH-like family protein [Verrucomicrobiae bacterium]|nr:DsrE/DsrF/DrsH-like family protein [Verrucomicrobiae bacterium]